MWAPNLCSMRFLSVVSGSLWWLKAFQLDAEGVYQEVAKITGDEVFEAERPFPVRIVPRDLLGRLG
jgi:hypothetical protein